MGTKVVRWIIGILIGCAVLVGIYFILPGQYHYRIKEFIQKNTNRTYKEIVREMKTKMVPGYENRTFGDLMSKGTEASAWTVSTLTADKSGNGTYQVYADGYKVDLDIEHAVNDDTNKSYSRAHVRLVFNIEYMEKKITKVTLVKIKVEEDNFVPKDVYYSEILQGLMERAFGK
jgi:hypothetical protein